jgi:hypothetical protein
MADYRDDITDEQMAELRRMAKPCRFPADRPRWVWLGVMAVAELLFAVAATYTFIVGP